MLTPWDGSPPQLHDNSDTEHRLQTRRLTTDGEANGMTQQPSPFSESDPYERFMGRWSRRLAREFVKFASVDGQDSVLDVGCGIGSLSFAIADAFPSARVTGVDPSAAFVRQAQQRAHGDRVRIQVGDAQALEFADAMFDKTVSQLVLNFVPDREKAVREMMRVTRSGGLVAGAVWDYGDGMQMLRVFWDEAVAFDPPLADRDERHMPLCKRGELAALWRAVGFERVDEQPMVIDLAFSSFEDYWTPFLGGQGPAGAYVVSLSDQRRATLEAKLRDRLLSSRTDGPFVLQARAWAVKGTVGG
jgi:SAM-dependent methyltransferase